MARGSRGTRRRHEATKPRNDGSFPGASLRRRTAQNRVRSRAGPGLRRGAHSAAREPADLRAFSSSLIQTLLSASESHRIMPCGSWAVTTGRDSHPALKISNCRRKIYMRLPGASRPGSLFARASDAAPPRCRRGTSRSAHSALRSSPSHCASPDETRLIPGPGAFREERVDPQPDRLAGQAQDGPAGRRHRHPPPRACAGGVSRRIRAARAPRPSRASGRRRRSAGAASTWARPQDASGPRRRAARQPRRRCTRR